MSRAGAIIVAQLVAAVLSLAGIFLSLVMQLMQSSLAAVDSARLFAFLAIVLITAMVALKRRPLSATTGAAAVALTLAAGASPHIVYWFETSETAARFDPRRRAELAAHDAKALRRIETRTRDVEARLAGNRPYQGQDALDFVDDVDSVDLEYLGLPDRSDTMLALLRRALAARLIDPNALVKGPRPVDRNHEPLFVQYYRRNINPYPSSAVRPLHWEIFRILAASGADLALAGDLPIAQDLQKQLKADHFGIHRLQ
jgi:hypothetical protein